MRVDDGATCTQPIVLAHGIARFDELARKVFPRWDNADDRYHYFRGIRSALTAAGYTVHHASVPWAESVKVRAARLGAFVDQVAGDNGSVHIIAHSMGGLDARHMLYEAGLHDAGRVARVASLSTIGTPHLGCVLADAGIDWLGGAISGFGPLASALGGFFDLTTESCSAFNDRAAAFERDNAVVYRTYAGVPARESDVSLLFRGTHRYITQHAGPNDGLVERTSAMWRDALFAGPAWDADHLHEIGWWDLWDMVAASSTARLARIHDHYLSIAADVARGAAKAW